MNKSKKLFSIVAATFLTISSINAAASFTGFTGGKLNYSANPNSSTYDPELKLQAFLAGQFNFSQNLWAHMEFSIDTNDLISKTLFDSTDSLFQVDEISIISRTVFQNAANYFSAYMGTYDPIGSDLFLQRYFGIEPIASKITESWLGLAGSILYPHFGIGVSDVIKSANTPWAFGTYAYINHEDAKYFVLNFDLRTACTYRFFTCDFAGGIGAPLANKYKGTDVLVAIEKLYWHAGTTILFGNNYTPSLFMQAGLFNASFTAKSSGMFVGTDDIYLLIEPRFVFGNNHINLTAYSLPQETVNNLLFVDDTLGADLNFYSDSLIMGSHTAAIGAHICASFTNKDFLDLADIKHITSNGFNVNFVPYFSTNLLDGQLHAQMKIKFMELAKGTWFKAFTADISYTCKL